MIFRRDSLERKLAELESGLQEMEARTFGGVATSRLFDYIRGMRDSSKSLYEKYSSAKRSLESKNVYSANRYVTEFAMDANNLTASLNKFLQEFYSGPFTSAYKIELKDLESYTSNAPKLENGQSVSELFLRTHDYTKENIVRRLRNIKGHFNGNQIIRLRESFSSDYELYIDGEMDPNKSINVSSWLDKVARDYINLTNSLIRHALDTNDRILSKDEAFVSIPWSSPTKIQLKNFIEGHKKPFMVAGATALLSAGLTLGAVGMAWHKNIEMEKEKQEFIEKQKNKFWHALKEYAGLNPSYLGDYWTDIAIEDVVLRGMEEEIKKEGFENFKLGINTNNYRLFNFDEQGMLKSGFPQSTFF